MKIIQSMRRTLSETSHMYVVEYMLESVVTEKVATDLALAVEIPGDILIRIRLKKFVLTSLLAKLSQYRI